MKKINLKFNKRNLFRYTLFAGIIVSFVLLFVFRQNIFREGAVGVDNSKPGVSYDPNTRAITVNGFDTSNSSSSIDPSTGIVTFEGDITYNGHHYRPMRNRRVDKIYENSGFFGNFSYDPKTGLIYLGKDTKDIPRNTFDPKTSTLTYGEGLTKLGEGDSLHINDHNGVIEPRITGPYNIKLPRTITVISGNAFRNETNLISVEFPPSLKTINEEAFANTSLSSIIIPNTLTDLSWNVFSRCPLTSVVFQENSKIKNLKSIFLGSTIISLTIPKSVETLDELTFYNCINLDTVNFEPGSQLKNIGYLTFGLSGINTIELPESLTTIGIAAFFDSNLEYISIPSSVTEINPFAFAGCTNLKEVTFIGDKSTVDNIKFPNNSNKNITTDKDVNDNMYIFISCKNLKKINNGPDGLELPSKMSIDFPSSKLPM